MIDYVLLEKYAENKSILIVEDDKNIIKESKELLELIFNRVETAYDGKEGIEKYNSYFKENKKFFDLVITDIQMPNMDGIELTKEIYKINFKQILIVLSAHTESTYLLELVNLGISHFITKPINYDSFLHVLFTKLKELDENENVSPKKDNSIVNITEKLSWDRKNKTLFSNNEYIKLTKKEILLLDLLLKYNEKPYTTDEIINFLWNNQINTVPDISNIKNIISRLRKKVPELDIENIYGFGYRINLK